MQALISEWRPPLPTPRLAVLFLMAAGAEGQSSVFSERGEWMSANGAEGWLSGISVTCTCVGTQRAVRVFTCLGEQFALGRTNRETHRTEVHTYIHLLYLYAKQLLPTHQYSWVPAAETGTDAGTCQTRI